MTTIDKCLQSVFSMTYVSMTLSDTLHHAVEWAGVGESELCAWLQAHAVEIAMSGRMEEHLDNAWCVDFARRACEAVEAMGESLPTSIDSLVDAILMSSSPAVDLDALLYELAYGLKCPLPFATSLLALVDKFLQSPALITLSDEAWAPACSVLHNEETLCH